jgi:hypothetical protein
MITILFQECGFEKILFMLGALLISHLTAKHLTELVDYQRIRPWRVRCLSFG